MRPAFTGYIEPREWRWVLIISCGLALLAFSPFFWISYQSLAGNTDSAFMGLLHGHIDGSANLARMSSAQDGGWLVNYLHTPEPHDGALTDLIYILLGRLAGVTSLSVVVIYHVARVCAAVFMYMTIYHLAATIWSRVRTRRFFFMLASMGSGLGWLFSLWTDGAAYLDLTEPGGFAFYSSLTSVHLPLAIASLCLLASVVITVTRPDETPPPTVNNGGVTVFCVSLVLALLYPLAFLPVAVAFALNILLNWTGDKRINTPQAHWLLWFLVPPLPVLMYYLLVLRHDPIVSGIWTQGLVIAPPSIAAFLISLGLPLLIAVPGLYRAVRRFERDGNQFMLIWLVMIVLLIYLPVGPQVSFIVGVMIPVSYFATRALEDVWMDYLPANPRYALLIVLFPLVFVSNALALVAPIRTIYDDTEMGDTSLHLPFEYADAFRWIAQRDEPDVIVLAAPDVGLWLPVWARVRVVYGHPTQTLDASQKRDAVLAWYSAETCDLDFLRGESGDYRVRYVLYGRMERRIGSAPCLDSLTRVANFATLGIYRYDGRSSP